MYNLLLSLLTTLRLLFFYLAAPPLLCAIILFYAIDDTAITKNTWVLSKNDFQRAKNIIGSPHSKAENTIQLNQKDLNIALSYLLNYYTRSTSLILVKEQELDFKISIFLNNNFFGNYLNISFKLSKHQGYPVIHSFQIGALSIADEFAGLILESIIKYTPLKDYYILAAQHIRNIEINATGLTIDYITSSDLDFKKKLSLNNKHYQSVIFYQQQITRIIAQHDPKWRLSLSDLLQPLFKSAYHRSNYDNAIAENRAVLIAISSYVNKNEIQAFLPFDISPVTDRQYPASLYKRIDMAQHFMISATLAATGAETLAHILGEEKELNDAKRGSGFSFIDLAGDRAGLRFGKTAIESKAQARRLQQRMSVIKDYTAFMPDVRDLPENLSEQAFKRQFQSVYSVNYQKMLKKIDQRIDGLPIYR